MLVFSGLCIRICTIQYWLYTIYFPLGKGVVLKACAGKKSFKVHRGVLIAKCGQNADHLGILDSQIVQITRRWHGLPRKMGHASRFVENDKILMAMFSFYFVVAKKKSYISMVSEVFSSNVSCFRPSRVFWIHVDDNLKEELTFQLLNVSLNFHPCHPQQTCAPLGMRCFKDLHMDFAGVGNSLQAGFPPGMVQVAVAAVERAVADSSYILKWLSCEKGCLPFTFYKY